MKRSFFAARALLKPAGRHRCKNGLRQNPHVPRFLRSRCFLSVNFPRRICCCSSTAGSSRRCLRNDPEQALPSLQQGMADLSCRDGSFRAVAHRIRRGDLSVAGRRSAALHSDESFLGDSVWSRARCFQIKNKKLLFGHAYTRCVERIQITARFAA